MKKKPSYNSKKTTGGISRKPKGWKKSDTELLDRSPDTGNGTPQTPGTGNGTPGTTSPRPLERHHDPTGMPSRHTPVLPTTKEKCSVKLSLPF
jgi:hypothetical protein